jgi:hypothetical protein
VDDNPITGYQFSNLGSELVIVDNALHAQLPGVFDAGTLQTLPMLPLTSVKDCELAVPLAILDGAAGGFATRIRILFENPVAPDLAPDSGYLEYRIAR